MDAVKALVREMLKRGVVEGMLAPVAGMNPGGLSPYLITKEGQADAMALEPYFPISLAKLIARYIGKGPRTGLVVRTCDARALVELAKREQVDLARLMVIGIECAEDGYPFPWCRRCEYLVPSMADVAFYLDGTASANTERGKELAPLLKVPLVEKRETPPEVRERALRRQAEDFAHLLRLTPAERLRYWLGYFDRCIKCYGCRNSCPLCFCKDCYLEPHKLMVKPGGNPPDKLYHLVRLMHIGDSCVNCGRCEATCPMGIPISRLYHMLQKELSALFRYEPGLDLASPPPLGMITEEEMKVSGVELA